ncbi:MAG TPA: class F sortase [Ornithinibacter sp.]|nr:class F sortase [Ornithinibacter sp.]
MKRGTRSARWAAVSAVSAVTALGAVVALVLWASGRPGPSAGADLADVRRTASAPSATATPTVPTPAPSPSLPQPRARDASLGSLQVSPAPAPTRLVISGIDVDARVDDVGVEDDGAMVIPAAPTSVGWYRYGSAPSDARGNTVIAGHVATREDGPGALAALRGAAPGMRVTVTTADGRDHDYEVVGRRAIVKKALPVDEIFARDGRPLLVLITCGGEYLPELRSHRDNIVVTAAPVG